jgi:hypothetical protein
VKFIFKLIALLTVLFAGQVNAAFLDAYSVGNWNKSIDRGAINTTGAPNSIKLIGSNTTNPAYFGERNQDFTIASIGNGYVTFDWNFKTNDSGGAGFDPFGWLLNGVFTKLTNDSGKKIQSGTFTVKVHVGDIFGFRANSVNSISGTANTTISNFFAPTQVPVPAAFWLMGAPLLGFFVKKRKVMAL